ncbi:acetolactate synthase, large subunit, biosynthetic type [compost metagenome]
MTGNEMIAAVEHELPILFIVSNNNCYGSIRIHQDKAYPGRHLGTTLSNPDFVGIARSFGVEAERVTKIDDIEGAIQRGLLAKRPYFIEVQSSLSAILPGSSINAPAVERSGD